jgi:hypothetical protein
MTEKCNSLVAHQLDTELINDNCQPTCCPPKCYFCGSTEVVFIRLVGDARCEKCGAWQTEEDE